MLELFQEQYEVSLIRRKMEIDTTNASILSEEDANTVLATIDEERARRERLQEFIGQVAHFVTNADRLRILTHRSTSIDWL